MTNPIEFYWGIEPLKGYQSGLGLCKMPTNEMGKRNYGNIRPSCPIFDDAQEFLVGVQTTNNRVISSTPGGMDDSFEPTAQELEEALGEYSYWSGSLSGPVKRENEINVAALEQQFGQSNVKRVRVG